MPWMWTPPKPAVSFENNPLSKYGRNRTKFSEYNGPKTEHEFNLLCSSNLPKHWPVCRSVPSFLPSRLRQKFSEFQEFSVLSWAQVYLVHIGQHGYWYVLAWVRTEQKMKVNCWALKVLFWWHFFQFATRCRHKQTKKQWRDIWKRLPNKNGPEVELTLFSSLEVQLWAFYVGSKM